MTSSQQSDQAHEALAGCGERLRMAREAAGLSIDDVAARLRMPHRVVRSLENEDWSRLGAPVFVRGQVRSYSRLLGLTTAPMMDALMVGQVEPTKLVSRTHIPKAQWWAEQIGRRLVYIVLTLSLAIPVWVATRQHLAGTAEGVAALDAPADPAAPAEPEADRTPRTVVASMTPVAANAQPAAVKALAADAEIVVRTSAKTWLEVVANDGSTLAKELLPAGAERRYAASQVRRMTIGNASAVALESRGRPVDALANARANVARFEVSSDGSLVASN
ncbi:helix-turn-helix domain-containing protein [Thermomonas fusca]|uniref:Helix-turn-helix domain-containing protein n=1 Tax=Thermomonas fusca TaxID=215690 RepID=A0A5R9PH64_9GAMM|nr:helix-turn-helix domain-containing protein [Thermomonas fusca]TLX22343.1 helix-turn-helix domain-containing protein [Thermomonas fusca]